MFALRLMGGVGLQGPDGPVDGAVARRQRLSLLAFLAVEGDEGISRDRVIGVFWPDSTDARARHALSNDLYAIRGGLGESVIVSHGDDLRFDGEAVEVDARSFEAAVAGGDLERAAALYNGPFMDGVRLKSGDLERWVDGQRSRLSTMHSTALETLALERGERGLWTEAVEWWQQAAGAQPLNSRFTMGLMTALARSGDLAGALRQARTHAQLLSTELAVGPDDSVEALAQELRVGATAVIPPHPSSSTSAPSGREGPQPVRLVAPDPGTLPEQNSIAVLPFANLF